MAPINLPDGTEVSEVILPDGTSASEVVAPDGSTVFSAIPDGEIDHHWDPTELSANDQDTITSFPDTQANADLSGGDPIYDIDILDGTEGLDYDGADDTLSVAIQDSLKPRNGAFTWWAVFQVNGATQRSQMLSMTGASGSSNTRPVCDLSLLSDGTVQVIVQDSSSTMSITSPAAYDDGSPHLAVYRYDGGSSHELRIDTSSAATDGTALGDVNPSSDLHYGSNAADGENFEGALGHAGIRNAEWTDQTEQDYYNYLPWT